QSELDGACWWEQRFEREQPENFLVEDPSARSLRNCCAASAGWSEAPLRLGRTGRAARPWDSDITSFRYDHGAVDRRGGAVSSAGGAGAERSGREVLPRIRRCEPCADPRAAARRGRVDGGRAGRAACVAAAEGLKPSRLSSLVRLRGGASRTPHGLQPDRRP